VFPDETVGRGAKSKGKTEHVEEDATGGGVQDIRQHDVHGVLGTYRTSTKHGKAKLHGEYKVS